MKSNCASLIEIVAAAAWLVACGAAENSAPSESGVVRGSLDKRVIRGVIHEQIGMIHQCLSTYGHPGEGGRIAVRFIIRGDGNVTDASVDESTFDNPRLEKCVLAAPQYWRFPKPEGGGIVIVTYPFEMSLPPGDAGAEEAPQREESR